MVRKEKWNACKNGESSSHIMCCTLGASECHDMIGEHMRIIIIPFELNNNSMFARFYSMQSHFVTIKLIKSFGGTCIIRCVTHSPPTWTVLWDGGLSTNVNTPSELAGTLWWWVRGIGSNEIRVSEQWTWIRIKFQQEWYRHLLIVNSSSFVLARAPSLIRAHGLQIFRFLLEGD